MDFHSHSGFFILTDFHSDRFSFWRISILILAEFILIQQFSFWQIFILMDFHSHSVGIDSAQPELILRARELILRAPELSELILRVRFFILTDFHSDGFSFWRIYIIILWIFNLIQNNFHSGDFHYHSIEIHSHSEFFIPAAAGWILIPV